MTVIRFNGIKLKIMKKDIIEELAEKYLPMVIGKNNFETKVFAKKCAVNDLINTIEALESIKNIIPNGKITLEQAFIFEEIQTKIDEYELLIKEQGF